MTRKWFVVTLHASRVPDVFFPSNIFPEVLDAKRLTYKQAQSKPIKFWKDKNLIFHMSDRGLKIYKPFYKKIIKNTNITWLKFACGTGATNMPHYDNNPDRTPFSHYKMMSDLCKNFLWEMPMNYNFFPYHVNKVPQVLYDKKYEKPMGEKPIDFLLMMDDRLFYNYTKTLYLGEMLKSAGYNVHGILIDCSYARQYNNKCGFNTTLNKKNLDGQKKFHKIASKSKIMIDFAFRWTYGRVIYEALFNNCICIGTHTYGAMEQLFPDLTYDVSNYDVNNAYDFCVKTIEKWSPKLVNKYKIRAREKASPQVFKRELNKATDLILDDKDYEFEGF